MSYVHFISKTQLETHFFDEQVKWCGFVVLLLTGPYYPFQKRMLIKKNIFIAIQGSYVDLLYSYLYDNKPPSKLSIIVKKASQKLNWKVGKPFISMYKLAPAGLLIYLSSKLFPSLNLNYWFREQVMMVDVWLLFLWCTFDPIPWICTKSLILISMSVLYLCPSICSQSMCISMQVWSIVFIVHTLISSAGLATSKIT